VHATTTASLHSFSCELPELEPAGDGLQVDAGDAGGASRRVRAREQRPRAHADAAVVRCRHRTVAELMEDISNACFYRVEVRAHACARCGGSAERVRAASQGWWTFELCVRKHVRQFHQEKDVVVSEYVLGRFDEAATAQLHAQAGQPFSEEASPSGTPTR
jgi:hypothetical protein